MHKTVLRRQALGVLLAVLLLSPPLYADRTRLKPGWNIFSEKQEIELGRNAAQEAEQQLPLLNKPAVDDYLNRLGRGLARYAPGYTYPYQFKAVNQGEINAFALPGGFLYINRGTIEAAENEAQLAGVMAHEIAHVALRHGTNQLTKAYIAQFPLAILGGFLGGGSAVGQLAQLGIAVGFSSVFLKFSRTAETQADILGTQMLFDAGYNPQAVADFFETVEAHRGSRGIEFFSSHPNPGNRRERIEEEIEKLGQLDNPRPDSEEFHVVRGYLESLPPPPKPGEKPRAQERIERRPQPPSRRFVGYRHPHFVLKYPANWEVHERDTEVVFAPAGGVSGSAVAYGAMLNVLDLEDRRMSLQEATDRLVRQMLQGNPGMQEVSHERARVGGRRALAVQLRGQSPFRGERETDWLFTVRLGGNLFYAIFVVPESDYGAYQPTFQEMLDSVRFR